MTRTYLPDLPVLKSCLVSVAYEPGYASPSSHCRREQKGKGEPLNAFLLTTLFSKFFCFRNFFRKGNDETGQTHRQTYEQTDFSTEILF